MNEWNRDDMDGQIGSLRAFQHRRYFLCRVRVVRGRKEKLRFHTNVCCLDETPAADRRVHAKQKRYHGGRSMKVK